VPVERIELPTFGLQNRCSTAELNRRTRIVSSLLPSMSAGQARRQIPELSGKGYSHERDARTQYLRCWHRPLIQGVDLKCRHA
jgi:hypothetical protein